MTNWRLLEDELCDLFRKQGLTLDVTEAGNKFLPDHEYGYVLVDITELAQRLAERVELRTPRATLIADENAGVPGGK